MAARFGGRDAARSALQTLRDRFRLASDDVSLAPMGSAEATGSTYLLAGRFDEGLVRDVRDLIERSGGEVVADVDEGRTRPRFRGSPGLGHANGWGSQTSGTVSQRT